MPAFGLWISRIGLTPHKHIVIIYPFLWKVNEFYFSGSNFILEVKKLEILAFKWLLPIEKNRKLLNAKITTFELSKMPIKKERNELLDSLRPVLRWRCPEVWTGKTAKPKEYRFDYTEVKTNLQRKTRIFRGTEFCS